MVKVSVILPVYNRAQQIEKCLIEVMRQTLEEKEIICVDDGSTDGTTEVLKRLQKCYPSLVVHYQKNQGAGCARNVAMKLASGEYIAFLDSDDRFYEDVTLERIYEAAIEQQANICGGSMSLWIDKKEKSTYEASQEKYGFKKNEWIDYRDYQWDFGFQRFIFKRSFLQEHQIAFPSYRIFEDPPFLVKAMIAAKRFYAISSKTYAYRVSVKENRSVEEICAKIQGLADELKLSREARLPELHQLAYDRLDAERIMHYRLMQEKESAVEEVLERAEKAVDWELLPLNRNDIRQLRALDDVRSFETAQRIKDKLHRELLEAIKNEKKIVLYGAGVLGQQILAYLKPIYKSNILGVAVSSMMNENKRIDGYPIRNIKDYVGKKDEILIVIAVTKKYEREILLMAEQGGFPHVLCIEWKYLEIYV